MFPGIGAFITLITMYITLPRLSNKDNKKVLLAGMVLFTFSNLVFLFVPPKGFVILLVSIFLGSISMAVIGPYLETCWANSIKNDKRANVVSYSNILIVGIGIPAGAIGGYIYTFKPIILFVVIFSISAIMSSLALLLILNDKTELKQKNWEISSFN